jgi:hypothetical protein
MICPMLTKPIIGRVLSGVAVLLAGAPTAARPEPLVIEQLADPDATLVAAQVGADRNSALDYGVQGFSRAIADATLLQQQAMDATCRSTHAPAASAAQRFAWEANCRYRRH